MPLNRAAAAAMINITQLCIIAYVITCGAGSARRMRIETTSRGGFTDANWNAHRRQCSSECERLNAHYRYCVNRPLASNISFLQANSQSISASTMYAIQSNANSCMPSAPLVCSGSPPRCCRHLLSGYWCSIDGSTQYGHSTHLSTAMGVVDYECRTA